MVSTCTLTAGPARSLTEVRLLAMCLVAFAGFIQCDELIMLKGKDTTFIAEGMVIRIVSSKTDQYREGSSLIIVHTGEILTRNCVVFCCVVLCCAVCVCVCVCVCDFVFWCGSGLFLLL